MWVYRLTLATCVLFAASRTLSRNFLARVAKRKPGDLLVDIDGVAFREDHDAVGTDDVVSAEHVASQANDATPSADVAPIMDDAGAEDRSQVNGALPSEEAASAKDDAEVEEAALVAALLETPADRDIDEVDDASADDDMPPGIAAESNQEKRASKVNRSSSLDMSQQPRSHSDNLAVLAIKSKAVEHDNSATDTADDPLEIVTGCDDETVDCESAEEPEKITDVVSGCDDATVDCESPQDLSDVSVSTADVSGCDDATTDCEHATDPIDIVSGCDDATVNCEAADD